MLGRYIEEARVVATHSEGFLMRVEELEPEKKEKYFMRE